MNEAQEKITDILIKLRATPSHYPNSLQKLSPDGYLKQTEEFSLQILEDLEELGYHKLPEGKPPLLSEQELLDACRKEPDNFTFKDIKLSAKAQWDSDIKWYGGEK